MQTTSVHKTVSYKNYEVNYYLAGNTNAQTVVFLHAAFADHRMFNHQIKDLNKHYQILSIDMMGHGLTQPSKTKDKIDETVHHLKEILLLEKIAKVHIVGVSMGSLMAQYFAQTYSEFTMSLTVVGGYNINADNSEVNKAQRSEQFKWMFKALLSMKAFRKYVANSTVIGQEKTQEVYEMAQCFKLKSFRYMSGLGNVIQFRENIKIQYPLLIVVGDKDIPLAQQIAKAFHTSYPQSKFISIPSAGHCANMDKPETFNKSLRDFIEHIS